MIEAVKYSRRPFEVDAVQVTSENMAEVATWCGGEIVEQDGNPYIKVPIKAPAQKVINDRQTKAFVQDWVLHANNSFKVYTPKAFSKCFEAVNGTVGDAIVQASKRQPEELRTINEPAAG